MTNFDFLTTVPQFNSFSAVAVAAEKSLAIDAATCIVNCRRAMEFAIKWMYAADGDLVMPCPDTLCNMMDTQEFRDVLSDKDLLNRMHLIRKLANETVHGNNALTLDQAVVCLKNLYFFMDFVAYCYSQDCKVPGFNEKLLKQHTEAAPPAISEVDFERLKAENAALKQALTTRREEKRRTYVEKPMDLSEFSTRKFYIDALLMDAGWTQGKDWINELELTGMPNQSGVGYADYVLFGEDGRPLALVEAKKTCVDVAVGRQQAKLYADLLEEKYHRRPVIFLTNGFETRLVDNCYPERKVAAIYSKRDLEKLFNLRSMRTSLSHVMVDKKIAERYYQEEAIKAVCESFDRMNRRRALLVMATGSGKTRTIIALCKVLLERGWVKNILFLADRSALVTQARRSFKAFLPELSVINLAEDKSNLSAHGVFSTYQTMMNSIDEARDEEGKLFTCGHFDLVICDEAHRSVYNRYQDIFNYFDAPMVGLTATPKDEIDKNTYSVFQLENGVPTYGYELAQAVKDGYLVDFVSIEAGTKFLSKGIHYDELSEEDKEEYEKNFMDENGNLPPAIDSSALNNYVFNEDTIRLVLQTLMTQGLKIDYGQKIGKTIIFAKNHNHAEKILEVFNREYPHLVGYAMVIDNKINYAQTAIDEFSDPKKLPQIAISVDMLDTGIDVPEILNLVFFKVVMSKAKFWQMIGRGTRLCKGLLDGKDKEKFYIFDFCGNFEFFRMSKGKPTPNQMALQSAIFKLKAEIAYKLQDLEYQTDELTAFRAELVEDMVRKVQALRKDSFAVKQHLKYVELFSDPDKYRSLTYQDTLDIRNELVALILPDSDEAQAVRFDALMYGIELAYLVGKNYAKARTDLLKKVHAVAGVATIPEVAKKSDLLQQILTTDYLDRAGVNEFEHIRQQLRDLMKYIPVSHAIYTTDLDDEILDVTWSESELPGNDLAKYYEKAAYYIRQHSDHIAIAKLKRNQPLTQTDVKALEQILWSEVGTRQDYENEIGSKPLGEFVREIVGLDMAAAKAAFAQYLEDTSLDSRQIYFVNQIVEYIVQNGLMKDMSVLQDTPFTDQGSITEIFTDLSVWLGIRKIINSINDNAAVA